MTPFAPAPTRPLQHASALALLAALTALAACSSASGESSSFPDQAGGSGGGSGSGGTGAAGAGGSVLIDGGLDGSSGGPTACPQETQFVYVVTSEEDLYEFDPPSLSFSLVGHLACPNTGGATPFSMSVDRNGTAWVVFTDGRMFHVDVKNAACSSTGFVPNQYGFETFGMGFSSDAPGSTEETLFVTQSDLSASITGLAFIDTSTLKLQPIHGYSGLNARAEMTGTGDARLFGAFEGSPYVVAEIDKTSATILSQAAQSAIDYAPGSSNFAFAFWGGDFWLFVGPGTYTDVFQYQPASGTTSKRTTVSYQIVGAGVSTCAPVLPPA